MISKENTVNWLQNIIVCIKALEKNDEWKVYFGVACLSVVLSLLFALYSVFLQDEVVSRSVKNDTVQHLALSEDRVALKALKDIVDSAANERVVKAVTKPISETPSVGEWYYDDLHKDWRYKK